MIDVWGGIPVAMLAPKLRRDGLIGRKFVRQFTIHSRKSEGDGNLTRLAATWTGIRFWLLLFWVNRLFKTFVFGIILGLFGAGALAYFAPVIDIHRERSLIEVHPNGGNIEEYRINLPRD